MSSHTSASQRILASPLSSAVPNCDAAKPAGSTDLWLIGALLTIAGSVALWFFYSQNEILLSGDAVAHINIARRIFDSRTPGPLQLGTVWLPLPHLLTVPFVVSNRMWQSGIGASIVSLISYVFAGVGLFRLLSKWSRMTAWLGTAVFAANPNVLYVQSTALNEPLYLACFIWTVVFFTEASEGFSRGESAAGKWLEKGAMALVAAILTRYDGWFLVCVCWVSLAPAALQGIRKMTKAEALNVRRSIFKALLLTALVPTLWMAYNLGAYGNALDFANGPYSAKAIAHRTTSKDAPPYPGERSPLVSALYFTKAAQLNVGDSIAGKLILVIAALASLMFLLRGWLSIVLLWSPLAFYALSIAYGSVPVFLPVWWPFSYYNVRYGLELMPAIASGAGLAILIDRARRPFWIRAGRVCFFLAVVAVCYVRIWRDAPICLQEVRANGRARMELDNRLAAILSSLPPRSTVLAYTGAHSGAFQTAGFPLRRTINEGNLGAWQTSLFRPGASADYVVASDGDPVADAIVMHPERLAVIASIAVEGQPRTIIYRATRH